MKAVRKLQWPQKESDLAAPVIEYLQDLRWEVYQEVQTGYAGDIADIVARQGKLLWVIELKKSLSLEVIAQAQIWSRYAHYASVAIPTRTRSRTSKGRELADRIMAERGIGCIKVQGPESYQPEPMVVTRGVVAARLNRKASSDKLRNSLCEEQKTFATAGNSDGKRWTPFQRTCREVLNAVTKKPGLNMKELVDAVDHHYASDAGARAHLAGWIQEGVVDGVEARREGRCLRVYPIQA